MAGKPELVSARRQGRDPEGGGLAAAAAGFNPGTVSVADLFATFMVVRLFLPRLRHDFGGEQGGVTRGGVRVLARR